MLPSKEFTASVIKKTRLEIGITKEEMSVKLDITSRAYDNIEKGVSDIKWKHIVKLMEVFSCDIGYLTGEHATKRHKFSNIQKATGLDERVIEILTAFKKDSKNETVYFSPLDFINTLFSGGRDKKEKFIADILYCFNRLVILAAPATLTELESKDDRDIEALKHYFTGRIQQSFLAMAQSVLDERDEKEMLKILAEKGEQINYLKSATEKTEDLARFRRLKFFGEETQYDEKK